MESRTRDISAIMAIYCWATNTFRDGQSWAPLVSQDIQTYASVRVDIGVIDAGREIDFRRLEGIIGWKVYGEEENTTRVWAITLLHATISLVPESLCHAQLQRQSLRELRYTGQTYRSHYGCLPVKLASWSV